MIKLISNGKGYLMVKGVCLIIDCSWDLYFMCEVLVEVEKVVVFGEVLVGVVLVCEGEIIGWGFNWLISSYDFSVYVEMLVICMVVVEVGNYWLLGSILYVILEFCSMCFGLLVYVCI